MILNYNPAPIIQPLSLDSAFSDHYQFQVVRGDLIHPQISGNKWYKLKLNIQAACKQNKSAILSFGGAHSNHIHALAYAGKQLGMATIGVIRGQWRKQLTPTLRDAESWGMSLIFIAAEDYRRRDDESWIAQQLPCWLENTPWQTKQVYIVPEGGSNQLGVMGVGEWAQSIYALLPEPSTLILPVGSGGTLAGFAAVASSHTLLGVTVVRAAESLRHTIKSHLAALPVEGLSCHSGEQVCPSSEYADSSKQTSWELVAGYEGRGYGRWSDAMLGEIVRYSSLLNLPLEPVYSGKAFLAMLDLARKRYFNTRKVVFVHTGGMQGLRSVNT